MSLDWGDEEGQALQSESVFVGAEAGNIDFGEDVFAGVGTARQTPPLQIEHVERSDSESMLGKTAVASHALNTNDHGLMKTSKANHSAPQQGGNYRNGGGYSEQYRKKNQTNVSDEWSHREASHYNQNIQQPFMVEQDYDGEMFGNSQFSDVKTDALNNKWTGQPFDNNSQYPPQSNSQYNVQENVFDNGDNWNREGATMGDINNQYPPQDDIQGNGLKDNDRNREGTGGSIANNNNQYSSQNNAHGNGFDDGNSWNREGVSMGDVSHQFPPQVNKIANPIQARTQPLNIDDIPVGGGGTVSFDDIPVGGGTMAMTAPLPTSTTPKAKVNRPSPAAAPASKNSTGKPKFEFVKRGSRKEPTAMNRFIKEGRLPGQPSPKVSTDGQGSTTQLPNSSVVKAPKGPNGKVQPFARSAARVKNTSKFEPAEDRKQGKKGDWEVEVLVPPPKNTEPVKNKQRTPTKPGTNETSKVRGAPIRNDGNAQVEVNRVNDGDRRGNFGGNSGGVKDREEALPAIESVVDWDRGFDELQGLLNGEMTSLPLDDAYNKPKAHHDKKKAPFVNKQDDEEEVEDYNPYENVEGGRDEAALDWNDTWHFDENVRKEHQLLDFERSDSNENTRDSNYGRSREGEEDTIFNQSTMGVNGDMHSKDLSSHHSENAYHDEWDEQGGLDNFETLSMGSVTRPENNSQRSNESNSKRQGSGSITKRDHTNHDDLEPSELVQRIFAGRNHATAKEKEKNSKRKEEDNMDMIAKAVEEAMREERAELEELKAAARQDKKAAAKAKQQHEAALAEVKREKDNTAKWCASEKESMEKWIAEQRAALAREKKLLNRQAAGLVLQPPSKKERAEMEALRATIEQLRSEESRIKGRFKLQEQRLKQTASTAQERVKELEGNVLLLEKENIAMRHQIDELEREATRMQQMIHQNTRASQSVNQQPPTPSHQSMSTEPVIAPNRQASSHSGHLFDAHPPPVGDRESRAAEDRNGIQERESRSGVRGRGEEREAERGRGGGEDGAAIRGGGGGGGRRFIQEDEFSHNEAPALPHQREVLEFDNGARQQDRYMQEAMFANNDVPVGYDPNRYNNNTSPSEEAVSSNHPISSSRGGGNVSRVDLPPNEPSMLAVPPPPSHESASRRETQPRYRNNDANLPPPPENAGNSTAAIAAGDKIERRFSDGRVVTWYSNGTHKEVTTSGEVVVRFANGDIKRTNLDNVVTYYYESAQTTHTTYPNGDESFAFPSGQTERHNLDGTKEISFPDGTSKVIRPDGMQISTFPDGVVLKEYPQGHRDIISVDGVTTRESPDGSLQTL